MKRYLAWLYSIGIILSVFWACHAWAQYGGSPYQYGQTASMQPVSGATPDNVLIILDASQSMSEPINAQETKMVAAKRTILNVLQNIPASVPVGLRVYGISRNEWDACRSSDLVVPIQPGSRYAISAQLLKVRPRGATPISFSITQAVQNDFGGRPGKKSIILVSDGMETCDADPCDVAVSLMRSGADVKINVIGYGIQDLSAMKQLKCVALATKGKFYSANTSAQLANSLGEALGAQKNVQAQVILPNTEKRPAGPMNGPVNSPNQPPPTYGLPQYRIGY